MEYLSPLDAAFLDIEDADPRASMAIASVAVADPPAPTQDELAAAVRSRLAPMPRYWQRVRRVPFDLGPPVWVDDDAFDLASHLRGATVAAPGDDTALTALVARIMSHRLDRERPLWECWVIEGLAEGRWALLSKVHHCMVDGVAGNELHRLLFTSTAEPAEPVVARRRPQPDTGAVDVTLDALGQLARAPFDQLRLLSHAARQPGRAATRLVGTVRGLAALVAGLRPVTATSMTGPLSSLRRYAVARAPLAELTTVAKTFDVTVNDVFLAAVTGAFRRLIEARGELPARGAVRTLLPVSVRGHQDPTALDNRVAPTLVLLPVELADPLRRLQAVHRRVADMRASRASEASAVVAELARYEPFAPVSLALRLLLRVPQRAVVTLTSNVPGPREPLLVMGRPIRQILPYVPIADRLRTGIALFTYAGQAAIGVTADFAAVPEVATFAATIRDELSLLHAAAAAPASPTTVPAAAGRPPERRDPRPPGAADGHHRTPLAS